MAAADLWFGNTEQFIALPMPAKITEARQGYLDSLAFENGGAAVARSQGYAQSYEFTYPWAEASGAGSVDVFSNYAAGEHGTALCYFANPMAYDLNLFPRQWASPRVIENNFPSGWPNISTGTPTWANTAANSYSQPARKGTWTITTAANASPLTDSTIPYCIIPIPPTHTLQIGVTGVASGTAVVRVESWVSGATSAGATTDLTLLAETGATRMNATVAGSSYAYAKVYFTRTSTAASTVTPISMMAQLYLSTLSPTLPNVHIRGRGHSGLAFADNAAAEDWNDASSGRHYKSLNIRLLEVGAWL